MIHEALETKDMTWIILLLSLLFVLFALTYDTLRSDMRDAYARSAGWLPHSLHHDRVVKKELSAFFLSVGLLVLLNIAIGFQWVSPSDFLHREGVSSFFRLTSYLVFFVGAVLIPCANIVFGLQRLGVSRRNAAILASDCLVISEYVLFSKGWLPWDIHVNISSETASTLFWLLVFFAAAWIVRKAFGSIPTLDVQKKPLPSLYLGANEGSLALVTALIEEGEDINATTPFGFTALHIAAVNGHEQVVTKLLSEAAIVVDTRNAKGNTPLHCAAEQGFASIASLLIKNGAKVDARGNNGETPLHVAAIKGHKSVVSLLIGEGATIEITDDKGWTPEKCAEWKHHYDVAEFIRRARS